MRKPTLTLIIAVLTAFSVFAQPKAFIPDTNFRNFLDTSYAGFIIGDSLVIDSAATLTGSLVCTSLSIADLTGAEYFINITTLNCYDNQLTALPALPNLTALQALTCSNNQLTSIPDLTNNTALTTVFFSNNLLTSLPSLTTNTALEWLYFSGNQVTSIPSLSTNTALTRIGGWDNLLTTLPDLSNNTLLEWIFCQDNQMTSLPSLTNNTALQYLYIDNNQLSALPDLSTNTALSLLYCENNQLTALPDLTNNTGLLIMYCDNNQLTSLPSLSTNTFLGLLHCNDNQLTSIPDLSNVTNLQEFYCFNNQLTSLPSLTNNTVLADLRCQNNLLTSLPSLTANTLLVDLYCQDNLLTTLPDLSSNTVLDWFYAQNNKISSIPDMSSNTALQLFDLRNNKLDFSDATEMRIADAIPSLFVFWYSPQDPFGVSDTFNVNLGDTVVLSIASQDSALSYQWYNGVSIVPGATDTLLSIEGVAISDSGTYTCKSFGNALLFPPMNFSPGISEFVSEPQFVNITLAAITATISYQQNISCNGGNDGEALVSASGGTGPYTMLWSDTASQSTDTAFNLPAGSYYVVVTDSLGVFDTAFVTLTEPSLITGSQTLNICAEDSIVVGSSVYNTTGVFTDTLIATNGCDSVYTSNLTVDAAIIGSQTLSICAGDSISVGTSTYSSTGIFTDVFTASNGCDSTFTSNLTIDPAITGSQTLSICAGDSISVGTSTYSSTGIFTDVFTASNGCDSTFTSNLTVDPAITGSQTLSICAGDSLIVGGNVYYSTGVYVDTFAASNSCDSLFTTDLTIDLTITGNQTLNICAGDSVLVGSKIYNSTGSYTDTLTASNGCDSVYTTNLTVDPVITGSQALNICTGDSILVGSNVYDSTGTYIDTLVATGGCDSVLTTNLTVDSVITGSQMFTICAGDSMVIGSSIYSISGSYADIFTASGGCDSIFTTNLIVEAVIVQNQTMSICEGDSIVVGTNTYSSTGVYTDVFPATNSCDSTVITTLTVNQLPTVTLSGLDSSYCSIDSKITMTGSPSGGIFSSNGAVAGNQFFPATGANNYTVTYTYTDPNGCSNSVSQSVEVIDCPVILEVNTYLESQAIQVYPNPNKGRFTLEMQIPAGQDILINITNLLGQSIYTEMVTESYVTFMKEIDLNESAAGIYNLQVVIAEEVIIKKIVLE